MKDMTTSGYWVLAAAGSIAAPARAAWGPGYYGPGMSYGGWGGGVFGWFVMLLVVFLAVALAAGVLRWIFGGGYRHWQPPGEHKRTARDILDERFARGEIDREEFEEKRRLLSQ